MPTVSKFEECVYRAIVELTKISPDGELTYTKVLTCFLNGQANKNVPWEAIQKSKIYGKIPKANLLKVMMACNNLCDLGYLKKIKVGGNYKYLITDSRPNEDQKPKPFLEKISKHKRYLTEQFADYLTKVCPSLKGVEHDKYYGFINKNPVHFNEYNWVWLTDDSNEPYSLKVSVRYKPNIKSVGSTFVLSHVTFFDVVDEIIDILSEEKKNYKLVINDNIERPTIEEPANVKKQADTDAKNDQLDFSFFNEGGVVHFNDGSEEAINAALSTSESSPYKYRGDTVFSPKELKNLVQGKSSFEFSFIKWKVAAWTLSADSTLFIQNVLLVSKKSKDLWIVVSVPGRKVVCMTNSLFQIETKNRTYTSEEILRLVF